MYKNYAITLFIGKNRGTPTEKKMKTDIIKNINLYKPVNYYFTIQECV